MLSLVMHDDKSYSELHLNIDDGKYSLNGFTIKDNLISEFDKKYLEVFQCFKMTDNIEKVGNDGDYDVILDKEYGLYHFFKDGKEDFVKLFYYNTKNETLNNNKIRNNLVEDKTLRSFVNHLLGFSVSINLVLFPFLIYKVIDENNINYLVEYNNSLISVEKNRIFDTISYTYNENDYKFSENLDDEIRNLIFSSENLNEVEEEFLCNDELINLATKHYKGTTFDILSLIRHTDLKIESFTESEREGSNGYYTGDNVLHLLNYDVQNIIDGNDQCRDLGHEYIHLLQVRSSFTFVKESSAEIMSHEFYLKSSSSKDIFSYYKACKYLKILMEIIGSEPIIQTNFDISSDLLIASVQSYLDIEELNEFIYILKLSPFYDEEELENGKYDRLYELLSIIYSNKFGKDIREDDFINAIMSDKEYRRVYFSESLRDIEEEYYMDLKPDAYVYSLIEAKEYGFINVICEEIVSKKAYYDENIKGGRVQSFSYKDGIHGKVYINNNSEYICEIYFEDGTILELPLEEAEKRGYVIVTYKIQRQVSNGEFISNYESILNDKNYYIYSNEGYVFDNLRKIVYSDKDLEKISLDSLPLKMENARNLK